MALLKFKKGLYAELPEARAEGTVYITTDEKAMYVDINSTDRIRIGQIITLTKSDWQNLSKPFSEDVFYYITDINALIRWNGTAWVQINSTEALSNRITALETALNGDGTETNKGLIATVGTHGTDISTLKTTVGNTEGGLVKDIADIRKELEDIVSEGGEPNTIEKITIGGTEATITDYTVALGKLAGVDAKVEETDLHDDLKNKITQIQTTANAAVKQSDYDTKIQEIEGNISTANGKITGIENTLGSGKFSSTNTVTKVVNEILEDISGLKSHNSTQDETLESHGTDISGLKTTTGELDTAVKKAQADATTGIANAATAQAAAEAADTKAGNAASAASAADTKAQQALEKANQNATDIGELEETVKGLSDATDNYATKTELAKQNTELEGKITTAQNAADAAQGTANEAKGAAATNAGEITKINTAIGDINTTLSGKVDTTTYETRVGENGTLTQLAQKGVDDAKTAQDKADENAGLIATNTENIGKNTTAISELKEQIGSLSNIMNFIGVSSTAPAGNIVTIDGVATAGEKGDVVIFGNKEYVCDGTNWVEFGDGTVNGELISDLTDRVAANEGKITTLEGTVGDSTKGLVKTVSEHTTTINAHEDQIAELLEAMTWGSFTTAVTE